MKFFIFIFLLCKVCSAFGEDVIYLTSREQSSLKIVSNCLPDNESFESYKASIEDKKDFIEIIFFSNLMKIWIVKAEVIKCMFIMLI